MIAHIGFYVDNLKASGLFYSQTLKTINYEIIFENEFCLAYGKNGIPIVEIYTGKPVSSPIHIAFQCDSIEQVNLFYQTAIQTGAKDNGKPGYRDYFPNYYAGYVIDPNGHNLEALFFKSLK